MMRKLVFLKLGGSVITDKDRPNSANLGRIKAIAEEINHSQKDDPALSLLIGHGSGSFGHTAAQKYGTRDGVSAPLGWRGFAEVAAKARELNQIIIEQLLQAGVNVLSISPFSSILAEDRKIISWNTTIIEQCLRDNLVPVIYGDVILDKILGGIILSTEELFTWLAINLHPQKILLAGLEEGVWKDYPKRSKIWSEINPNDELTTLPNIKTSSSIDVTGGMLSKVEAMISLVRLLPDLEIQIFSANQPGNIYSTLRGKSKGTRIRNSKG